MAKRILTVDDVTGRVIGDWCGGDEQSLGPVADRTHIPVPAEDTTDYLGSRWDGGATFTPVPVPEPAPDPVLERLARIEASLDRIEGKA